MPAISRLPKPSFVKDHSLCIADQLNLADHVTSCNRKLLPVHFRAHACRTSSGLGVAWVWVSRVKSSI